MNETDERARDWLRSSVSSPGMPKTYLTPSASRHSTKTSDARLAAMPADRINRGGSATPGGIFGLAQVMRRPAHVALLAVAVAALACAPARAASSLTIKGAGY